MIVIGRLPFFKVVRYEQHIFCCEEVVETIVSDPSF